MATTSLDRPEPTTAEPATQNSASAELRRSGLINGAAIGAVFGLLFASAGAWLGLAIWLVVGGALGVLYTEATSRATNSTQLLLFGGASGALAGAAMGLGLDQAFHPALKSIPIVVWPVLLAVLAGGWMRLNDKNPIGPALMAALVGWTVATFGTTNLGGGTQAEALMSLALAGAFAGAWVARKPIETPSPVNRPFWLTMAWVVFVFVLQLAHTYANDESVDKLITTIAAVVVAVSAFTALWVGMNLIFNQATINWSKFSALIGAVVGFVVTAIIDGNRALQILGPRAEASDAFHSLVNQSVGLTLAVVFGVSGYFFGRSIDQYNGTARWAPSIAAVTLVLGAFYGKGYVDELPGRQFIEFMWWPLIGAALGGGTAWALSKTSDPMKRLIVGVVTCSVIGLIFGISLKTRYLPALEVVPLILSPIIGAGIGAAIATFRGKKPLRLALVFGLLGWILGTFGIPSFGGTRAEGILAFTVIGLFVGALIGLSRLPDATGQANVDSKARAWIFLTPAVSFISITLILPSIITALLSLRDNDAEAIVWLDNYKDVFSNPDNLNLSNWTDMFTSQLMSLGLILLVIGVGLAMILGRRTGHRTTFVPESGGIAAVGVVFLAFAVFTTLRGTIINNIWWVFMVTVFATGLGLAIAAWSDGVRNEKFAKSLIFMPMAISFVGASIIWRFVYRPQDTSKPQTGVLNAVWVWIGQKTTGASNLGIGFFQWELFSFNARWLFFGVFLLLGLFLIYKGAKVYRGLGEAAMVGLVLAGLIPLYLAYRIFIDGIGGFVVKEGGEIQPSIVLFLESGPFNNFWLMVVLLWIEVGFAMVILSAAIKAVPTEYIEAAKIDGADDTQVFWRITVPQIAPTIGVVVTTVIVRVTKVYDIVKVMTGGRSGTNVLANEMINQAFQFGNSGTGSALAILLFLSVLPIMVMNIRRMQREAA